MFTLLCIWTYTFELLLVMLTSGDQKGGFKPLCVKMTVPVQTCTWHTISKDHWLGEMCQLSNFLGLYLVLTSRQPSCSPHVLPSFLYRQIRGVWLWGAVQHRPDQLHHQTTHRAWEGVPLQQVFDPRAARGDRGSASAERDSGQNLVPEPQDETEEARERGPGLSLEHGFLQGPGRQLGPFQLHISWRVSQLGDLMDQINCNLQTLNFKVMNSNEKNKWIDW